VLKRILILVIYCIAVPSFAYEQYSEGTCILLKNQVKEFSAYPQSNQYKTAKRSVEKHCTNPTKSSAQNLTKVDAAAPSQKLTPLQTTNKLHSTPLVSNSSKPIKIAENKIDPFKGVFDLVIKVGLLVLAFTFIVALIKAIITLLAKRTAKALLNKVTNRLEPTVTQQSSQSILKKTIEEIVAKDQNKGVAQTCENGENLVNEIIDKIISGNTLKQSCHFRSYKNVLLTNDDDELTEIDHLIVSPFGVFVIESKNYSGFIFGSEKQAKWTQTLKGGKTQFMNPLRQNYKHCLAVSRLLGIIDGVESLVLFNDKASFKTQMPSNVRYVSELHDYLASYEKPIFSQNQLDEFNARLEKVLAVTSKSDYQQHINEVKQKWQAT